MKKQTPNQQLKTALLSQVASGQRTAEDAFRLIKLLDDGSGVTGEPLDIAVVGMAGRFPQAANIREFWANLRNGIDSVDTVPAARWQAEDFYDPDPRAPGKSYCVKGGCIDDADCFDPLFFNISPKEAELMDPQQRLFLEEAWHAFEDAGYSPQALDGMKCGVFVGCGAGDYQYRLKDAGLASESYAMMGQSSSILAARIAYFLNLNGPCLSIDTACSSSLVAIDQACQGLRNGSCELALAGGVMVLTTPGLHILSSKNGMLAKDGKCKTFDQSADGFAMGEAVGAVILKPLEKAMADGDEIYAVIKGSGVNQDGRTNGITAPNGPSQTALEAEVYRRAGIHPERIGYIEAHGTGTKLGDPIEVDALTDAFRQFSQKTQFCAIGSAKTNIGHSQLAAGIAGFIKAVLCVKHGELVPSLHYTNRNEHIEFESGPFYVPTELKPWTSAEARVAAVSSFGFSGTNAHVVIEEAFVMRPVLATGGESYCFFFSARNEQALRRVLEMFKKWLDEPRDEMNLGATASTLALGRSHLSKRLVVQATSWGVLLEEIKLALQSENLVDSSFCKSHESLIAPASAYLEKRDSEWRKFFEKDKFNRVHLPGYPFARDRYWVDGDDSVATVAAAILHPLLHANTSRLGQGEFSSKFSGEEPFFSHHKVNDARVLPGAAYLEMAWSAASQLSEEPVRCLSDVLWSQPTVVGDDSVVSCTRLSRHKSGDLRCQVLSGGVAENLHFQSKLHVGAQAEDIPEPLQITKLKVGMSESIHGIECYKVFSSIGLDYGTSFQTIQRVDYSDTISLAELSLPPIQDATASDYVLNPYLLDGAFQSVLMLAGKKAEPGHAYLPFALNAIRLHRPLPNQVWAYAEIAEGSEGNELIYDILLCDAEGVVAVEVTGFRLRAAKTKAAEYTLNYFRPHWEALPEVDIVGDDTVAPSVVAWNAVALERFQSVWPSAKEALLATEDTDWSQQNWNECDALVLLWPLVEDATKVFTTIASISRQLIRQRSSKGCRLVCLVEDVASLSSLEGFGRALMLEVPAITFQLVEYRGAENLEPCLEVFRRSWPQRKDLPVVTRYDERQLKQKNYLAIATPAEVTSSTVIRKSGVYLITGGMGALGYALATHLCRNHSAKVILTGRSAPGERTESAMQALTALGGEAIYRQADVTALSDLEATVAEAKIRFGILHGVIHAAGINRDSLLIKKADEDALAVIGPKTIGTCHLDTATAAEPLDFMLLYSSTAAVMGNSGQCDYAYANAYLNNFARERTGRVETGQCYGVTLSIAWPFWKEGGMTMDARISAMLEQNLGMIPLATDQGMTALETILISGGPEWTVIAGDADKISSSLIAMQTAHLKAPTKSKRGSKFTTQKVSANDRSASGVVNGIVSDLMKIPPAELDSDADLSEYGFDSISITSLANALNDELGLDITPSIFFEHSTLGSLTDFVAESCDFDVADTEESVVDESAPKVIESGISSLDITKADEEAIAIIGMSGVFPGASDVDTFWNNLLKGMDLIGSPPVSRWPGYDADWIEAGFIEGAELFDSAFFNISPREAMAMDPQQRLFLQTAWHVLEDAGYAPSSLRGQKVGVFVGVATNDYVEILREAGIEGDGLSATGNSHSVLANRVSYYFDFHGPSEPVDTACSSSLVAIDRAIASLRRGDSVMAIVGGVNLNLHPGLFHSFKSAGMLSPESRCRTFDAGADGYVRGEGCGAVVLKPLVQAKQDGDRIYAVIKGAAVNHGGRTSSLTAPNTNAQAELIETAWRRASVPLQQAGYIEAHGTGTSLGDPVEINGLKKAFEQLSAGTSRFREDGILIGSAKTNIGHLETAAGIAGLIKLTLCLREGIVPPSLHFKTLNPYIKLADSPLRIADRLQAWSMCDGGIRAGGVSSFGFGGANAHVVLSNYVKDRCGPMAPEVPEAILLSAKTEPALQVMVRNLLDYLQGSEVRLETADSETDALGERLITLLSKVMEMEADGFDREAALEDFGLDQVMFSQWVAQIENEYGIDLDAGLFASCDSIQWMAAHLGSRMHIDQDMKAVMIPELRSESLSLADVAWTLQTGREALGCRLACVADSIGSLMQQLQRFVDGASNEALFWHSVDGEEHKLASELMSEVGDDVVDSLLEKGKLTALCQLWVSQVKIDWHGLKRSGQCQKLSLPGYPFEAVSYWPLSEKTGEVAPVSADTDLHYYAEDWKSEDLNRKVTPRKFDAVARVKLQESGCIEGLGAEDCVAVHDASSLFESMRTEGRRPEVLIIDGGRNRNTFNGDTPVLAVLEIVQSYVEVFETTELSVVFAYHLTENSGLDPVVCLDALSPTLTGLDESLRFVQIELLGTHDVTEEQILDEIRYASVVRSIRLIDGGRFILALERVNTLESAAAPVSLSGVFWILGGAGAIGQVFGEYLARKHGLTVILSGRSPAKQELKQRLAQWREEGLKLAYVPADITNSNSLAGAVSVIRQEYGKIQGVVHCAGALGEGSILTNEPAVMRDNLAPKLPGVCHVHEVLADDSPEYFMIFSSTSSILGDFGQGTYALGNRFLDRFAQWRSVEVKESRTLCLNWPLWKAGGMHGSRDGEALYLQATGQRYLEVSEGIRAFEDLLNSRQSRICIFAGDRAKIDDFVQRKIKFPPLVVSAEQAEKRVGVTGANLEDWLVEAASAVLQLDTARLNMEANLTEFGFESLTMNEFAREIGACLDIPFKSTAFFSHASLAAVAIHLKTEHGEAYRRSFETKAVARARAVDLIPTSSRVPEEAIQTTRHLDDGRIAVIGMSGQYPGCESLEDYWEMIDACEHRITSPPENRSLAAGDPERIRAGFLGEVDHFEASFFSITPKEARAMDPQQRLFLQCCYNAFEDAGYIPSDLKGQLVGVFAGVQFNDYQDLLIAHSGIESHTATGNAHTMIANRVSYVLDLTGPSETVNTACSGSLVAVHHACSALRNGECEMAVAGGVSLMLALGTLEGAAELGILSPDGLCKTFDAGANGYVKGEGVGSVVLKRLDRAISDGDYIHAVIDSSASQHGGRAQSLTAPKPETQAALLQRVWNDAGITGDDLGYLELHGTGTALGDPIEVEGIQQAWKAGNSAIGVKGGCALGSVKANIGHLEPAAGIAGLTKAILALKNQRKPGVANFQQLNPLIDLEQTPFVIEKVSADWSVTDDEVRRAGVSSFGFGGSIAHLVISEAPLFEAVAASVEGPLLFIVSASDEAGLTAVMKKLKVRLAVLSEDDLASVAYTLQCGRADLDFRFAVLASSLAELNLKIESWLAVGGEDGCFSGTVQKVTQLDSESVRQSNWAELAQGWVAGATVPWQVRWSENPPRRISLPGKIFRGKSYWYQETTPRERVLSAIETDVLVDWQSPFIQQHRVAGQCMVPGVAYIDWVVSRVGQGSFKIEALHWLAPLSGQSGMTSLGLSIDESGTFTFQSEMREEVFCRGRFFLTDGIESLAEPLATIRKRCNQVLEVSELYRYFSLSGLDYGPDYRNLTEIHVGDGEAYGRGHYTATTDCPTDLPPTFLDSVLHLIGALNFRKVSTEGLALPWQVDCIEWLAAVSGAFHAAVRCVGNHRYDVDIYDGEELLCGVIRGFTLRELPDPLAGLFYHPDWQWMTAAPQREISADTLILTDSVSARLPGELVQSLGLSYEAVHTIDEWDIEAWKAFVIEHNDVGQWFYVVDSQVGENCQGDRIVRFLRFVQGLLKSGQSGIDVTAVTRRGTGDYSEIEGIHAIAGCAARESDSIRFESVVLGEGDSVRALSLRSIRFENDTAYRLNGVSGDRLTQRRLLSLTLPAGAGSAFRKGGVYIIVGGAGGIGRELTRYLSKQYQAKVVWFGRRPNIPHLEEDRRNVEASGGELHYLATDITDLRELEISVAQLQRTFPRINGVIHSALVLKDRLLANMDEETFQAALRPKLAGTSHLLRAFESVDLDFMTFFSSAQSFSFNGGQSNYAAGCLVKDSLANQSKAHMTYPVKVVNWGYWGSVGVVADDRYRALMKEQGVDSISPEEGFAALERFLVSSLDQVMIMKAAPVAMLSLGADVQAHLMQAPGMRSQDFLTEPISFVKESVPELEDSKEPSNEMDDLQAAALHGLHGVLVGMDWLRGGELVFDRGLAPHYERWAVCIAEVVKRHPQIFSRSIPAEPDWVALLKTRPQLSYYLPLLQASLAGMPEVLTGESPATDIIFPQGSTHLVDSVYGQNDSADLFNETLARNLVELARRRDDQEERVRIIEIGSGTGSTAIKILEAFAVAAIPLEYVFTDLSPGLVLQAKKRFAAYRDRIVFLICDIEAGWPVESGVTAAADFVVAVNVLHATRLITETLCHVKSLLRPGGCVVISEMVDSSDYMTMTFGLLEGWWHFEDSALRIPGSPLLSRATWKQTLEICGFSTTACVFEEEHYGQEIIFAVSDGWLIGTKEEQPLATKISEETRFEMKGNLEARKRSNGVARKVLRRLVADLLEVAENMVQDHKAFSEIGIDSIVGVQMVEQLNAELKLCLKTTVIFDFGCIEVLAEHIDSLQLQLEREQEPVGIVSRQVEDNSKLSNQAPVELKTKAATLQAGVDLRVRLKQPGGLDSIALESFTLVQPEGREVLVDVRAFSLNFGDWLCVQGLYPTMPEYPFTPGFELSGVVEAVGPDVEDLLVGDEVIALTGAALGGQATRVVVERDLVVRKPSSVSFEEAAAFPAVFLTSSHVMAKAQLQPGDSILIQTAAGGVGLILVQMALAAGARVFATAGSEAKLAYLRELGVECVINYQTDDFETAVRRHNRGHGVDVVINMLSGDSIQKGLNLLEPDGRYVEIAMTALKGARSIDLSCLDDNQTFFSVDMRKLMLRAQSSSSAFLEKMSDELGQGVIRPTVCKVCELNNIQEAYAALRDRENIGKVVVAVPTASSQVAEQTTSGQREQADDLIAVVGMSGRFPKSSDLDAYWDNLVNGRDCVTEVPSERWDIEAYYDPDPENRDKTYCRWGGYLEDIDQFDPTFFNMSGLDAEVTDPQQRLFLETCWNALEDAGFATDAIQGKRCSVFAGVGASSDYSTLLHREGVAEGAQAFWGNDPSVVAARIAYFLDLKGSSISVNTACSSSLVATHLACKSLLNGENEIALAGGVFLSLLPGFHVFSSNARMLSPTGKCKAFSADADGFVPGEGCGVVVLKRLQDAERDGDQIHAVIRASELNQDGKTNGITAPSSLSQSDLERLTYEHAGVHPSTISYIETHGTGTRLGDPIEIDALNRAFETAGVPAKSIPIGSVKSNIGHAAAAAGVASLLKVLLCLKHKALPPSLHFSEPNPMIDFENSPFYVNTATQEWRPTPGSKRRAAVSSFGFSGTNAHIVVEEYSAKRAVARPVEKPHFFAFSAQVAASLQTRLKQHLAVFKEWMPLERPALKDVAWTLWQRRKHFDERVGFLARSWDEAIVKLERLVASGKHTESELFPDVYLRWLDGETVDAGALWIEPDYRVVSLPTYPYERSRYWPLGTEMETDVVPVQSPAMDMSVPVEVPTEPVETLRLSCLEPGKEWEAILDADSQVLQDHQVDEVVISPGVMMLELALRIGRQLAPGQRFSVRNSGWHAPCQVNGDKVLQVSVSAALAGKDHYSLKVFSQEEQGVLPLFNCSLVPLPENVVAVSDLQFEDEVEAVEVDSFYQGMRGVGVVHGPLYRCLDTARCSDEKGMAEMNAVPPEGAHGFIVNPISLDVGFQCAALLLARDERCKGQMILPYALKDCHFYKKPEGPLRLQFKRAGPSMSYDIDLYDAGGIRCVSLRGLQCRAFVSPKPEPFYALQWRRSAFEIDTTKVNDEDCVVFHAVDDVDWGDMLTETSGELPQRIEVAPYGMMKMSLRDCYKANVLTVENRHLIVVMPRVSLEGHSLSEACKSATNCQILAVFHLLKHLAGLRGHQSPSRVTVVTQDAYQVASSASADPVASAVSGLVNVAAKEMPQLKLRTIDLGSEKTLSAWRAVTSPYVSGHSPLIQRYDAYWERTLAPLQLKVSAPSCFRENGVYLILGGAGGIGMELCRYLAKNYRARLILIGRREPDVEKRSSMEALRALGGDYLYLRADATNSAQFRETVATAKQKFGAIHGAIHSAAVLDGKLLIRMDEASFLNAFESKSLGTIALGEALRDEALDFVALFSSAGVLAQPITQSNYAAGCLFKDSYAAVLKRDLRCPVFTINWGFWGGVGLVASEDEAKRFTEYGYRPIIPKKGFLAFEAILKSGMEQVVYVDGEEKIFDDYIIDPKAQVHLTSEQSPAQLEYVTRDLSIPVVPESEQKSFELSVNALVHWGHVSLAMALEELVNGSWEGRVFTEQSLRSELGIVRNYYPLFSSLLELLCEAGILNDQRGDYRVEPCPQAIAPYLNARRYTALYDDYQCDYPNFQAHLKLIKVCSASYRSILRGDQEATEVLFPSGSMALVEGVYKANTVSDSYNHMLAETVRRTVEQALESDPDRIVSILEVGAGTGGTSQFVLEVLENYAARVRYVYTDISSTFLNHGEDRFGERFPFLEFETLNVEMSLRSQGFDLGQVDLVLASNVLHATEDVLVTLQHCKQLLRRGGLLVLNETTHKTDFATLTFGLTKGWWLAGDGFRIPGSPLLRANDWTAALQLRGFKESKVLTSEGVDDAAALFAVIVAESDGVFSSDERRPEPRRKPKVTQSAPVVIPTETVPQARIVDAASLKSKVIEELQGVFAQVLRIKIDRLIPTASFDSFGIDSLVVVTINQKLEAAFGVLPVTLLFEHQRLNELADWLIANQTPEQLVTFTGFPIESSARLAAQTRPPDTSPAAPVPPPGDDDALLRGIDSMNESELDALIAKLEKEVQLS